MEQKNKSLIFGLFIVFIMVASMLAVYNISDNTGGKQSFGDLYVYYNNYIYELSTKDNQVIFYSYHHPKELAKEPFQMNVNNNFTIYFNDEGNNSAIADLVERNIKIYYPSTNVNIDRINSTSDAVCNNSTVLINVNLDGNCTKFSTVEDTENKLFGYFSQFGLY